MGVSGQREKSLSPKTQKNDDDNAIRKIVNTYGYVAFPHCVCACTMYTCVIRVMMYMIREHNTV